MLDQFLQFIQKKSLFHPSDAILLAVSGGIDSVVMAHLFSQTSFNFAIAHCNFALRGQASDEDERFVQDLAATYEVPFYVEHFDTENFASEEKISIEMAARELRYAWFGQLLKSEGYTCLATAHHRNDVLETVLLNLVKGTGIAGLRGIPAKNDRIIRPLHFATKDQILAYAETNKLEWREDSTNNSEKFQRNLMRHKVVPVLTQINPRILKALESTVERVEAVEAIFYNQVDQFREKYCFTKGRDFFIDVAQLIIQPGFVVILDKILEAYGYNYAQSQAIAQKVSEGIVPEIIGKTFNSHTHRLDIDREHLIISPIHRKSVENLLINEGAESVERDDFVLTFEKEDAKYFELINDKNQAALDFHILTFPLTLRKWEPGDWFIPLGMSHKKKLSDFMIDRKIPLNLKDKVHVITSGKSIVWVVGHRIDDRFKVTKDTRSVYQIRLQRHD